MARSHKLEFLHLLERNCRVADNLEAEQREPGGRDTTEVPRCHLTFSRPVIAAFTLLCLVIIVPNVSLWLSLERSRNERNKEQLFWLICHPGYTSEQRSRAFAELLWLGNREWRSARLARLDLAGAQLAGASISQARMEGCKLSAAELVEADLRHTQFDQADLSGADLSRANLFECDLFKADLRGAIFMSANLRGAELGQSDAADAKFVDADMTAARLDLATLTNADFRLADLTEANLSLADLSSANLLRANFSNANLDQANLSNSNWWRAKGLSANQVAEFEKLHPPSEDAGETLKQDFEKWLAEQDAVQPTNDQSKSE
jgi:uncharacterized protein YjbI with pentapeptide repeats